MAIAVQTALVTQRLLERLTEQNAAILNRVMGVNVQVSSRFELNIKAAVPRQSSIWSKNPMPVCALHCPVIRFNETVMRVSRVERVKVVRQALIGFNRRQALFYPSSSLLPSYALDLFLALQ